MFHFYAHFEPNENTWHSCHAFTPNHPNNTHTLIAFCCHWKFNANFTYSIKFYLNFICENGEQHTQTVVYIRNSEHLNMPWAKFIHVSMGAWLFARASLRQPSANLWVSCAFTGNKRTTCVCKCWQYRHELDFCFSLSATNVLFQVYIKSSDWRIAAKKYNIWMWQSAICVCLAVFTVLSIPFLVDCHNRMRIHSPPTDVKTAKLDHQNWVKYEWNVY